MNNCPRCDGTGYLKAYSHIRNGVCFKCAGTGKVTATRKPQRNRSNPNREQHEKQFQARIAQALADPRVWESSRMRVTADHPMVGIHALEVFEWHEKFGWQE